MLKAPFFQGQGAGQQPGQQPQQRPPQQSPLPQGGGYNAGRQQPGQQGGQQGQQAQPRSPGAPTPAPNARSMPGGGSGQSRGNPYDYLGRGGGSPAPPQAPGGGGSPWQGRPRAVDQASQGWQPPQFGGLQDVADFYGQDQSAFGMTPWQGQQTISSVQNAMGNLRNMSGGQVEELYGMLSPEQQQKMMTGFGEMNQPGTQAMANDPQYQNYIRSQMAQGFHSQIQPLQQYAGAQHREGGGPQRRNRPPPNTGSPYPPKVGNRPPAWMQMKAKNMPAWRQ